jgi:hypothetical protein
VFWFSFVSYSYLAYGLNLKSKAEIQGLRAIPGNSDPSANDGVEVFIGATPAWVEAALRLPAELVYAARSGDETITFRFSALGRQQFFQFSYLDGTRFVVDAEMRRIWGACPLPFTQEDLGVYLLGPIMGFVLRRRGILALHASCFCVDGRSFALCGAQGTGKSTTAAALALKGIPIPCEDIAALRERDGEFWIAPGYPRVNLWPESAASLFGTPDALPTISPNWEKRFLPLDRGMARFEDRERQLAAVYILEARSDSDDAPRIAEISAREAALLLVQNTYMNYLLEKEQRAAEFAAIARLLSRTAVRRLIPHSDPEKIAVMCELLQMDSANIAKKMDRTNAGQPT